MKLELPWKRKKITLEDDLRMLESKLEALFQPVQPRVEFVKNLRVDLVGKPKRRLFPFQGVQWQQLALLAGGIVSFLGLVLGGIRIIVALLALFQGSKKRFLKQPLPKEAIAA